MAPSETAFFRYHRAQSQRIKQADRCSDPGPARALVLRSEPRHGIGDNNPLWCDPAYAARTNYGRVQAPPSDSVFTQARKS